MCLGVDQRGLLPEAATHRLAWRRWASRVGTAFKDMAVADEEVARVRFHDARPRMTGTFGEAGRDLFAWATWRPGSPDRRERRSVAGAAVAYPCAAIALIVTWTLLACVTVVWFVWALFNSADGS